MKKIWIAQLVVEMKWFSMAKLYVTIW